MHGEAPDAGDIEEEKMLQVGGRSGIRTPQQEDLHSQVGAPAYQG